MDIDGNSSKENEGDKEKPNVPEYGDKEEEELKGETGEKPKEESIRTVNRIF